MNDADHLHELAVSYPIDSSYTGIHDKTMSRTDALKETCDSAYSALYEACRRLNEIEVKNCELIYDRNLLKIEKRKQAASLLTNQIAINNKEAKILAKQIKRHTRTLHDNYPKFAASYIFDQQKPGLRGRYGETASPQFQIDLIPGFIDKDKYIIQFGAYQLKYPRIGFILRKDNSVKLQIMQANGLDMPCFYCDKPSNHMHIVIGIVNHTTNLVSGLLLGFNFNDYFRKVNYSVWCAHDETRIKRFCRENKLLVPQMVYRYNRFKRLIKNAIHNQEEQIIPAIILFGKSVPDLKNDLGNYLWRNIVKSSPTRNILIFSRLMILLNAYHFPENRHYGVYFTSSGSARLLTISAGDLRSILDLLYTFPSSFLKMSSFFYNYTNYKNVVDIHTYLRSGIWATTNSYTTRELEQKAADPDFDRYHLSLRKSRRACIFYLRSEEMKFNSNLYVDTKRMAENLERTFNPEWSFKRMNREHKNLMREGFKARVANRRFNFDREWPQCIVAGEVKATLLDTTHSLLFEGSEMHHCVGSYANIIDSGECIIYSLLTTEQNNEIYRSTLQLMVRGNKVYPVQNRSMYNNSPIQLLIDAANEIAAEINRWLLRNQHDAR